MKKIAAALICAAFLTACVSGGDSAVTDETVSEAPVLGDSFTETVTETSSETTVTTTETATEATTADIPFEDTVQNAYQRLMASFETESGIVYPDDYGGVYSYAGTLFVNITENEPPESYTSVLGDYTCVRYETVERSFNRLTEISLEAKELLDEEFGVDEYFVDVPDNTAAVTIRNEDPKKAQNFLKTVETKSFTLDELSISMAETDD
ncbi:MAG: hypothetical protein SOT68_08875 [Oscillospiraceae bacterium]|nr:hypothetical protein [Oscillospiraceae bacterium]MDD7279405.1 hypothetical protein [Oscillospiraceae bacterium]MDY2864290.1 hypothetical protein [Oscillospiraceae bacterium]